jgi:hypothetical protein
VRAEGLGKFKNSPHLVSNPPPSALHHNALTTMLQGAPIVTIIRTENLYFSLSRDLSVYFRAGINQSAESGFDYQQGLRFLTGLCTRSEGHRIL